MSIGLNIKIHTQVNQREEECDNEGYGEESGEDCECD